MRLTDTDRAMLSGEDGAATRLAMELLVAAGEADGAEELIDIVGSHIDGCLYHGAAGLDFARLLADGGGAVRVPTTLNVSSLDLLHPELYRGDPVIAGEARALMDAYVGMGCSPTWTCAPYQLAMRPRLGDQIAWGESNAIVFANSVLGARTGRYGDFLDICCALTGRAPLTALHTDEGRLATVEVRVDVPDRVLDDDLLYPTIGHVLGEVVGSEIAVITGLDSRADEDRLKALGAAAASSGSVAMFHVAGVTPEAANVAEATGGKEVRSLTVGVDRLRDARTTLGRGSGKLGAVSVGTPHLSAAGFADLAKRVSGLTAKVPFYVNTSRDIVGQPDVRPALEVVERFGATIVTDTCTYITPIMGDVAGVVMTDSAKWAFYAPGNLGLEVAYGGIDACVHSAASGEIDLGESW